MDAATCLQAASDWQAIEFVSDLHLCVQAPRTVRAFGAYLAQTDADAVFILGDLFDMWIGDDMREQPFERDCLATLAGFGTRHPLFMLVGNRDFLLGHAACERARMRALPDPTRLDAFGQALLLSHGDALCLSDTRYQAFRSAVRDPAWQRGFLAQPLSERAALARRVRSESQGRKEAQHDPGVWADVDDEEARRWLAASGATTLVHGHTHRPGRIALGRGLERLVLADWDLDGAVPRGAALRLDADGWHVRSVADGP